MCQSEYLAAEGVTQFLGHLLHGQMLFTHDAIHDFTAPRALQNNTAEDADCEISEEERSLAAYPTCASAWRSRRNWSAEETSFVGSVNSNTLRNREFVHKAEILEWRPSHPRSPKQIAFDVYREIVDTKIAACGAHQDMRRRHIAMEVVSSIDAKKPAQPPNCFDMSSPPNCFECADIFHPEGQILCDEALPEDWYADCADGGYIKSHNRGAPHLVSCESIGESPAECDGSLIHKESRCDNDRRRLDAGPLVESSEGVGCRSSTV